MNVETKKINIVCPTCKKEVGIDIPSFLVSEAQDGILKIQIPQEKCCFHSFMIFIDKAFRVRGYQIAELEFNFKIKKIEPEDSTFLSFDINEMISALGFDIAAMILRAILVGNPILFMRTFDLNDNVNKTLKFLQEIGSDDIAITTRAIEQKELGEKALEKSNPLVYAILFRAILRSPFKDKIKTALEATLLRETTDIPDRQGQIAFLRHELVKISRIVNELFTMLKSTPFIYEEDLPEVLQKKFNYKINRKQADGIKEILAYRHGDKIASKIKSKTIDYML
nr:hypothetical protein [Candidatus Sigynarchaeota archaeon]